MQAARAPTPEGIDLHAHTRREETQLEQREDQESVEVAIGTGWSLLEWL